MVSLIVVVQFAVFVTTMYTGSTRPRYIKKNQPYE